MIEKYWKFDVDRFFSDYDRNQRTLKSLIEEKDVIADIGGISYDGLRVSGGRPDPTADKARRRENIDDKINEIKEYFDLAEKIYSKLDNTEKQIVDKYFKADKKTADIRKISYSMGYSESWMYQAIRDTRKHIQRLIAWT